MPKNIDIPFDGSSLSALWDPAPKPGAMVVLAHGSGAGKDHPFLQGFSETLAQRGIGVLRFNFPYMDLGKKFPDRAPRAIEAWSTAYDWAESHLAEGIPVFAAGKSFGGRMASLAAAEGLLVPGLIFLGYPLHAHNKSEKRRDEHLYDLSTRMLFLQGTKDPFAMPETLENVVFRLGDKAQLHWIEGGDHSFKTARSGRSVKEDGAQLAERTVAFINSVTTSQ